jgi:hypothetical protein
MYCEKCLECFVKPLMRSVLSTNQSNIKEGFYENQTDFLHFYRITKEKTYDFLIYTSQLDKMTMKKKFVICSLLVIILTACILSTGCTSSQSGPTSVPSTSPVVTTPQQTMDPAAAPGTMVTTVAPAASSAATVSPTGTAATSVISVTINSAEKKTTLFGASPMPGNIFLVLDVTIKNNDQNEDFRYTDASFAIFDKKNQKGNSAITSKVAGKLENAITSGMIPMKSEKTGQIVFGVLTSSKGYKFSVIDSTGTVITTIDNIVVP